MASSEKTEKEKAGFNLKHNNIQVQFDAGNLVFVIPKELEQKLQKEYNFSVDALSVGGDIPLPELAIHCDEQASMECHIGMLAEFTRMCLKNAQDEFEAWYWSEFNAVKSAILESQKTVTDKTVESCIKKTKRYLKKKMAINEIEMRYRLLNNVIRSAIITKGSLLGTLRSIIQGSGNVGIGSEKLNKKLVKEVRKKVNLTKGKKNAKKSKKQKEK
jgi:hypothetical protein